MVKNFSDLEIDGRVIIHLFLYTDRGIYMTDNERELLQLLRSSDNPNALSIALNIILTQLESSQGPFADPQQEHV